MAYKDYNCTCESYCSCGDGDPNAANPIQSYPPFSKGSPCGCEGMDKDPHCEMCLGHLTTRQEAKWRQSMGEPVVEGASSCCAAVVEERILQTYGSETIIHICRTCGQNCQPINLPSEY